MKENLVCYSCKNTFPRNDVVYYASNRSNTQHPYCRKCLEEKKLRDEFSDKVCQIFGIKTPGPRIWTERKRLINNYGYTDNIIINCLDYIYNVKKYKKLSESLCLINPSLVDEMLRYKKTQLVNNNRIISAMNQQTDEYIVPIAKNKEERKEKMNPDDYLFDDD